MTVVNRQISKTLENPKIHPMQKRLLAICLEIEYIYHNSHRLRRRSINNRKQQNRNRND